MGVSQLPHSCRAQMLGRHCSSLHILIKFPESPITRALHLDSTSLSHSPLSLVRVGWGSLSRASSVRTRMPLSSCLGTARSTPDSSNVSLTAHILKATSPGPVIPAALCLWRKWAAWCRAAASRPRRRSWVLSWRIERPPATRWRSQTRPLVLRETHRHWAWSRSCRSVLKAALDNQRRIYALC